MTDRRIQQEGDLVIRVGRHGPTCMTWPTISGGGLRKERRTDMERKEEEKKQIVRLGLIYNVERQRFDIVYKDLVTNQIRIVLSDDQESEEAPMSISAA